MLYQSLLEVDTHSYTRALDQQSICLCLVLNLLNFVVYTLCKDGGSRSFPGWCIGGSLFVGDGLGHDLVEPTSVVAPRPRMTTLGTKNLSCCPSPKKNRQKAMLVRRVLYDGEPGSPEAIHRIPLFSTISTTISLFSTTGE